MHIYGEHGRDEFLRIVEKLSIINLVHLCLVVALMMLVTQIKHLPPRVRIALFLAIVIAGGLAITIAIQAQMWLLLLVIGMILEALVILLIYLT